MEIRAVCRLGNNEYCWLANVAIVLVNQVFFIVILPQVRIKQTFCKRAHEFGLKKICLVGRKYFTCAKKNK